MQTPDDELPGGFGVPEPAVESAKVALARNEVARKLTQVCVCVCARERENRKSCV